MAGQAGRPSGIDFDDAAYVRGLKAHIEKMEKVGQKDVLATGIKIVGWAKYYAAVLTGFMRSNIVWEEGRDSRGYFVAIYCRAFYWKFVEFGTKVARAQPFMRPAWVQGLEFLRKRRGGK